METLSSSAIGFKDWLDIKATALPLFGWCSIVERNAEMCITIGLLLASFLLSNSAYGSARRIFVRDNLIAAILTCVNVGLARQVICFGVAFGTSCISMQDNRLMPINLDWNKATRRDERYWNLPTTRFFQYMTIFHLDAAIGIAIFNLIKIFVPGTFAALVVGIPLLSYLKLWSLGPISKGVVVSFHLFHSMLHGEP